MSPSPVIEVAALVDMLGQPGVSIVDASWYLPVDQRDPAAEYRAKHIPGAVFFDIDAVSDTTSGLPHTLAQPESFTVAMQTLGINAADTIVVYDSAGIFSAARAWWNFRVAGVEQVFVLNGGLPAWEAAGKPVESVETRRPPGDFVAQYDWSLVRSFEAMLATVRNGGAQIVDARGAPRFQGTVPEPRPGLASGHITGSRNLHYANLLSNGRLKPVPELRAAFDQAGVDVGSPVVATCGSGVTAAIVALSMAALGYSDVPIYDGSWSEWGGRPESSGLIATGPAA